MILSIIVSLFPVSASYIYADNNGSSSSSLEELKKELQAAQQQKKEKEQRLNEAEGRLAETQSSLKDLSAIKNSYQGELNTLNAQLQEIADKLDVIEAELDIKRTEILETRVRLKEAEERSKNQYESMKKRICYIYEAGDSAYIEMLFSAKSFGEFLNYADYIEQLNAYDRRMLAEYIANQETISSNLALLEEQEKEIEKLEAEAVEEQNKVLDLIANTSNNLNSTASTMNEVQKLADAYEADCDRKAKEVEAANAEYEAIKAEYEEELRLSKLAAVSSWRDISQVTFDEGDRYLLANLIYCEAGGEPYEGQIAVGAVVINRLLSSVFPNTITGVIYQNKQFSPVKDGHLASALANNKATASCYQAADAAMSGATNVGGCVFFRTPIPGLTGLQIGHHIFY